MESIVDIKFLLMFKLFVKREITLKDIANFVLCKNISSSLVNTKIFYSEEEYFFYYIFQGKDYSIKLNNKSFKYKRLSRFKPIFSKIFFNDIWMLFLSVNLKNLKRVKQ